MTVLCAAYGAAVAGYAILILHLLSRFRRAALWYRLVAAAVLSMLWCCAIALMGSSHAISPLAITALEVARDAGWLLLLTGVFSALIPHWLKRSVEWGCVAAFALLLVPGIAQSKQLVLAALFLALIGIVLVEQIFRNAAAEKWPWLLPLLTVTGGQFVYDLFLYGAAVALGRIDSVSFALRGILLLASIPLLVASVRKSAGTERDLFIARHVVFYSSTFATVGIYLTAMAVGGYYVRNVGGRWGEALQLLFLGGAAVVLMGLFWSGKSRRWLRVVIAKNFYRSKYDYRSEWSRFVRALADVDPDNAYIGVLQAVAQVFASERAVLFMAGDTGARYCAMAAWNKHDSTAPLPPEVESDAHLVHLMANRSWIIDLSECRQTGRALGPSQLPAWLLEDTVLRVVVPIPQGDELLGFMVLAAPPPPFDFDYEDRDLLVSLSRHVAVYLARLSADRELAESRQFETYSRLSAFLMHDLRNAAAQLQLVVTNAAQYRYNPEFVDDAMATIENTARRIASLTERLRSEDLYSRTMPTRLDESLERAITRCSTRTPNPVLAEPLAPIVVDANTEQLASVFENVIRNAQDATPGEGSVTVKVNFDGSVATVVVSDDGKGMDAKFVRDRLFRPFDSTKGASGMGIGAYQVREYIRLLGGLVDVKSWPGGGTKFAISIPGRLEEVHVGR